MLQVKNITITHKKDLRKLAEEISFVLEAGDKMAIIGEEGNGKSTLLKLIYDEALISGYAEWEGEIIGRQQVMGYLAQELTEQEKGMTVWEYCCQNPVFFDQTPADLPKIAAKLGIEPELFYAQVRVGQLSGGEKVKLQLAGILMKRAEVILMDEPSNDIDLDTLKFLEHFIRDSEAPVLYISHDETLIERTANKILHMEQLRRKTRCRYTVAKYDYRTYLAQRAQNFVNQERIAGKQREDYAKQQGRFLRIQQKVEHQQNMISRQDPHGGRLLKKKMHAVKVQEQRFEKRRQEFLDFPESEDSILIAFQEGCGIPAGKIVLEYRLNSLEIEGRVLARDIFLRVRGPERVGIMGKNGCGKTTLLRKIAMELLDREDIKVFYMPQNYEEMMDMEKSCVEFLSAQGSREEETKIRTYLGSMKYTPEEMDHPVRALSGGQKAKLFFLKMSLEGSQVLILDEPTRNFSPLSNPVIRKLLAQFQGAIISISHDRKYLEEVCNRVYCLSEEGLSEKEI